MRLGIDPQLAIGAFAQCNDLAGDIRNGEKFAWCVMDVEDESEAILSLECEGRSSGGGLARAAAASVGAPAASPVQLQRRVQG